MQSVGISENYIRQYIFDVAEENNVKEQNIAELVKIYLSHHHGLRW